LSRAPESCRSSSDDYHRLVGRRWTDAPRHL
jgi:hypothetical protein